MKEKTWKALYYAGLVDLSGIVGFIPVVGDVLADVAEDIAAVEIKKTLTPEQYDRFLKETRFMPDVPAMAKTLKLQPPSPLSPEDALREKGWAIPPSPLKMLRERGWPIP